MSEYFKKMTISLKLGAALLLMFFAVRHRPGQCKFFFQKTQLNNRIKRWLVDATFYFPPLLVLNGSIHTFYTGIVRARTEKTTNLFQQKAVLETEVLRMDGTSEGPLPGLISLTWVRKLGHNAEDQTPYILLAPGLTGDSNSLYIQMFISDALTRGYNCVVFNQRGMNNIRLETPQTFNCGYTGDFRQVVAHVRKRIGFEVKLLAVGWSLGSNYLAKYCGEEGEGLMLDAAACLACPIDFIICYCNKLRWSHWWTWALARSIGNYVQMPEIWEILSKDSSIDVEGLRKAKSLADVERTMIIKTFPGLDSVRDYYRLMACGAYLSKIRKPTLFLLARNDPIVDSVNMLDEEDFEANPYLFGILSDFGGHSMIWEKGLLLPNGSSWANKVVLDYFEAVYAYPLAKL